MTNQPTFLVVEAYPQTAREELGQYGASNASQLYSQLLQHVAQGATTEILYVADLDNELPNIEQLNTYDGIVWTGSSLTVYALPHSCGVAAR